MRLILVNTVRIVAMKATKILPANYSFDSKFDLKNKKLLIWLNVAGLFMTLIFLIFYSIITFWLREDLTGNYEFSFNGIGNSLLKITEFIVIITLVLIVHEAIHGFFFWFFSRHKPIFGFKMAYAYAAMPDWYFPRNQYLVIGAAPFVLINMIGIPLLAFVPLQWIWVVLTALMMNSSGAIGDLAVIFWLFKNPVETMALDKADSIELYKPNPNPE